MGAYFPTPLQSHEPPPEDDRPKVYECNDCGESIRERDFYYSPDGDSVYCEYCFDASYRCAYYDDDEEPYKCDSCETIIGHDNGYYSLNGKTYCESCGKHSCNRTESETYWEDD